MSMCFRPHSTHFMTALIQINIKCNFNIYKYVLKKIIYIIFFKVKFFYNCLKLLNKIQFFYLMVVKLRILFFLFTKFTLISNQCMKNQFSPYTIK